MNRITITIAHGPHEIGQALACIQLPENVTVPREAMTSWQDLIRWLFQNPEIIMQIIAAILAIFRPPTPNPKTK